MLSTQRMITAFRPYHQVSLPSRTMSRYADLSNLKLCDGVRVRADFRSDTITQPTPAMREAIATAPVGDVVLGDDPSVFALEEKMVQLTGKEAALFMPSGTMTNQIGLRVQVGALQSIICDKRSHIFQNECGGVAFHSQAQLDPLLPSEKNGHLTAELIKANITEFDQHHAVTAGIALENTLLGLVLPIENSQAIGRLCKQHGFFLHLDGARLWNASVATGISLREYCEPFDTISLCLSKGLGAPIGSVLVGPADLIRKASHFRKAFGGGWRQAGLLAAGGIHAIDYHWPMMGKDHQNAKLLSEGLTQLGFGLDLPVQTNQVWVNSSHLYGPNQGLPFDVISQELLKYGFILPSGRFTARLVTHIQVSSGDVEDLLTVVRDVKEAQRPR